MAEIMDGKGIKTIAFYLPQFHAIPENDRAWGSGFTEWTNLKKARPFFDGHYQPRVPQDQRYYNLLDDETKIWQANLAREHGLFGFCYYHYWFRNGKMLLEKPAEQMLANKNINMPFCFSWANENWSKRWDGGSKEIIAEQDYGEREDWVAHFKYLLPFFQDERYITLNGRPVFLIYKPEEIPNLGPMLECFQQQSKIHGFPGLCLMIQNPAWYFKPSYSRSGFSYQIRFQPFFALSSPKGKIEKMELVHRLYGCLEKLHAGFLIMQLYTLVKAARKSEATTVQQIRPDYDEIWDRILSAPSDPFMIECAFPDWDNSPRKANGIMHVGASPEKFGSYIKRLFAKVHRSGNIPLVFVNAWNEWCEGAYLEPDERYGNQYLSQLCDALKTQKNAEKGLEQ